MGKAKEETKELAVKKETALALPTELSGTWGCDGVDSTDLKVPSLYILQALSDAVGEGKGQAGDILRSTTRTVINPKGSAMEIIPIMTYKTWQLSKKINGKYEFQKQIPMTPDNVNDAWEWNEGADEWKRTRVLNFYVLLPADIQRELKALEAAKNGEMPDPDDALLPCVVSFRGTSYDAGKDLITHFKKAEHFGLPAAVTTFNLTTEFVKGDLGSYYVARVAKSRKTTTEELAVCKGWHDTLRRVNVIVDEVVEPTTEKQAEQAGDVAPF